MTATEDVWVTVPAAAERLGCSVRTVWRMVKRGELPVTRRPMDKRVWVAISEVEPCPTCGCLCQMRTRSRDEKGRLTA